MPVAFLTAACPREKRTPMASGRKARKKARQRANKQAERREKADAAGGETPGATEAAAAAAAAAAAVASIVTASVEVDGLEDTVAAAADGLSIYAAGASPPPSQTERRVDAMLAGRALAELSVEAAKKVARSAAVEEAAESARRGAAKDEVSIKLRALAGEMARAVAVEELKEDSRT